MIDRQKPVYNNIRDVFFQYEMNQKSAAADGDNAEAKHWKELMEQLLTQMTTEQRSLILDEEYYCDFPEAHKTTYAKVKQQETNAPTFTS